MKECKRCKKVKKSSKFYLNHEECRSCTLELFGELEIAPDEKHCPKCKKVKKRTEFYKKSNNSDGLNCWCKLCKPADKKRYCGEYRTYYERKKREKMELLLQKLK